MVDISVYDCDNIMGKYVKNANGDFIKMNIGGVSYLFTGVSEYETFLRELDKVTTDIDKDINDNDEEQ